MRILICLLFALLSSQLAFAYPVEQLKTLMPKYVPVRDGYLEYYRFGTGTPLVLITGFGTDITSWNKHFLARLADHHQVIVFNNRNVGGSEIHSDQYKSMDLAEDTYQLIEGLQLKHPAVLGLSMGGMIGLQLAILHQEKLGPLILLSSAIAGKQAVRPAKEIERMIRNVPDHDLGRFLVGLRIFFPASQWLPMAFAMGFDRFLPRAYFEIKSGPLITKQRLLIQDWIKDDAAAKKIMTLKLPVLVMHGDADEIIPPVNGLILARNIPHAQLLTWPNGGHGMMYQYPEEIADAVNDFVDEKLAEY